MDPQARTLWEALTFRTPAMLRVLDAVTEDHIRWVPPNGVNSIGWLLWHIAEVEDNWVREKLFDLPKRYPFGVSVKAAPRPPIPSKDELLAYFREVRALSASRLEATSDTQLDRTVVDETYGALTVRQVWAGAATSGAWHGGQIVYINGLLPR
jgi:hypothetical protein